MKTYSIKCSECEEVLGQINIEREASDSDREDYRASCQCSRGHMNAIDLVEADAS